MLFIYVYIGYIPTPWEQRDNVSSYHRERVRGSVKERQKEKERTERWDPYML